MRMAILTNALLEMYTLRNRAITPMQYTGAQALFYVQIQTCAASQGSKLAEEFFDAQDSNQ